MNPLPKEILQSFESLEKLILISFNEAVNIKMLTGSKEFLRQVTKFIQRIILDPNMKDFTNDFLKNAVFKPSASVMKKFIQDKDFMKNEKFDSEVDASMYPLPSMIYKIVKDLLKSNPAAFY